MRAGDDGGGASWCGQISTFQRREAGQTWSFLRDGIRYGRRLLRRRLESETMAPADPGIWRMSVYLIAHYLIAHLDPR
jgi:hypothetical protein